MFDRAQTNLLIFLCGLVLLTVFAVLAANVGLLPESETTGNFAKWGMVAVLAEIVGLFVIVARGVFSSKLGSYSITIRPLTDIQVDIARISWDMKACYLQFAEDRHPVRPVRSSVGPAVEIKLPHSFVERAGEFTPVEIYLKDIHGNDWTVPAFFLNQKTVDLHAQSPINKILVDYGYANE